MRSKCLLCGKKVPNLDSPEVRKALYLAVGDSRLRGAVLSWISTLSALVKEIDKLQSRPDRPAEVVSLDSAKRPKTAKTESRRD